MDEFKRFVEDSLRKMDLEFSELDPDLDLEDDLGIESLMRIELAALLERKFSLRFEDAIDGFRTVRDLFNYFEQHAAVAV